MYYSEQNLNHPAVELPCEPRNCGSVGQQPHIFSISNLTSSSLALASKVTRMLH